MASPQRNRSRLNLRWPQDPQSQPQYLSPQPFPSAPPAQSYASSSDPWDTAPVPPRLRVHSSVHLQQLPAGHSPVSSGPLSFPEPQFYRSASAVVHPTLSHQPSTQYLGANLHRGASVSSSTSSYYRGEDDYIVEDLYFGDPSSESLIDDMNRISLDADEAVRRFQKGELRESEQEWHKMVPMGAIEAFGKQEVQRQSIIFEVIKGERDYVADLRAIQDIFITGLRNAPEPIINPQGLADFIKDVFANWDDILRHHERMLAALFQRQKDQHPLIQSVSDIILDTVLRFDFRSAYEDYIKHYPISESIHRKELKSNPRYKSFLDSISDDPRIRKRDLITFLSRPVTRLPRLSLLLEQILKFTGNEFNHDDLESLPTILSILNDFLKSTQPGIEAAESKAKLWELCEHLEYQKGEIIPKDMDLNDESRTLVYSGPVVRRVRGETGFSTLVDLTATLLDNYFTLTRDVKRPNGVVKKQLMSRPIPLSHLQYGSFDGSPDSRREKSEDRGILDSLRYQSVEIYPFTIFHASNPLERRYILLVTSEALRRRWKSVLDEAIGLYKVRQEASMWYDPRTLTDGYFRSPSSRALPDHITGQALTAAPFTSGGRKFIAVGCRTGIYASTWGTENFKRALSLQNPVQLAAVHELGEKQFHRLVVQHEHTMLSYSLGVLARVALGQAQPSTLDATMERVAGSESNVLFFRMVEIGQRLLVMYASKRMLQVSPSIHALEAIDVSGTRRSRTPATFRPFGESGYVPKDAIGISPLTRNVGIVTSDGIVIADPTNFAKSVISVVPDFHSSNDPSVSLLKDRVADAKPLGLIRVTQDELMVVYDILGCYMTKYGVPTRSGGYVKWETQAQSYAYRGNHVFLFSPQFIEIRDTRNGRIIQVTEGVNIRLLYFNASVGSNDPIIAGMKGKKDDRSGASDRVVELAETVELKPVSPVRSPTSVTAPVLWDEWDM